MIRALKHHDPKPPNFDTEPALQNPTVAHCYQTWVRTYKEVHKQTNSGAVGRIEAAEAYRRAMPELHGYENICNFISCVSFAVNAGIVMEDTGARLLYYAQVAMNTIATHSRIKAREANAKFLKNRPAQPASGSAPAPES